MTVTAWLPGYARVDLDGAPRGAAYDEIQHPKLGWHTWEGLSWASAEAAFRPYPPHLAVFPPWPGREKSVARRQYVALDRHAYAFAGSENDDEYVVQVEVAGFAAEMRKAPDVVLRWLATEVVAPIEAAVGVPRTVVAAGFHDTTSYRGKSPLASPQSSIRLTLAELRAFSGHLGHQHMPPPDQHWDPGALPIDRILGFLKAPTTTTPQEDRHVFASIVAALKTMFRYPADDAGWSDQQRKDALWWWDVAVKNGEENALRLLALEARKAGKLAA